MKTMMLTAALVALALPACAATPHKLSPPTVSKQHEQAYNQTYQTDVIRTGGYAKAPLSPSSLIWEPM
jgi:hypothetical protein